MRQATGSKLLEAGSRKLEASRIQRNAYSQIQADISGPALSDGAGVRRRDGDRAVQAVDRAVAQVGRPQQSRRVDLVVARRRPQAQDRKSTRLNSSHSQISYAVFCLKKKINN